MKVYRYTYESYTDLFDEGILKLEEYNIVRETLLFYSNKKKVKINQYDFNGNFIRQYNGIREAERETGIANTNISACCNNKKYVKSAGGYIWKKV